jgi:hypothetical protein
MKIEVSHIKKMSIYFQKIYPERCDLLDFNIKIEIDGQNYVSEAMFSVQDDTFISYLRV